MKIVINTCCGCFGVNEAWCETHGFDCDDEDSLRESAELISAIENGEDVNGYYAALDIVRIPDESTDYLIVTDDGYESIIYVVNGKIHRKYWWERKL